MLALVLLLFIANSWFWPFKGKITVFDWAIYLYLLFLAVSCSHPRVVFLAWSSPPHLVVSFVFLVCNKVPQAHNYFDGVLKIIKVNFVSSNNFFYTYDKNGIQNIMFKAINCLSTNQNYVRLVSDMNSFNQVLSICGAKCRNEIYMTKIKCK